MDAVLTAIGYILLGVVAVAVLLPLVPVTVRFAYNEELTVRVSLCGIPLFRFPSVRPKKYKKTDKPLQPPSKPAVLTDLARSLKEDGVGTVLTHLQTLASLATGVMRRILAAVTVKRLILHLYISSEDASATAQNVGRVSSVLYPALTTLQAFVRVRHREVTVTPDYLAQQGRVQGDVVLRAVPYRIVLAILVAAPAYFRWKKTVEQPKKEEQTYG